MSLQRSNLRLIFRAMILTAMIAAIIACGDPKYHPPAIVVTFDRNDSPPASLNTGAYAAIAADVANDNANGGVTFSCTPAGGCGGFTPPAVASAVPTCYLAPNTVPAGNTVTVTATSVTDPAKFVSATITIFSGAPQPCP